MGLNRAGLRFDRRLTTRNLREGIITLDELNKHLEELEDVSHLALSADDGGAESGGVQPDNEQDDEQEE
jgi:hypothetical protein